MNYLNIGSEYKNALKSHRFVFFYRLIDAVFVGYSVVYGRRRVVRTEHPAFCRDEEFRRIEGIKSVYSIFSAVAFRTESAVDGERCRC